MIQQPILDWYSHHARSLPWRDDPEPWRVLVSEFMLQQTPVARVMPVFEAWLERWPTPADLAAEPASEVIRAWGRLGYPRRALRLHEAAKAIAARGSFPDTYEDLLALPGVGDYTASAVASFAFGRRHAVLDTNVRRVFARVESGVAGVGGAPTRAERDLAERLIPDDDSLAPVWAVATMELGALLCTARAPKCAGCPIADACRWRAAGYPDDGVERRGQAFAGTDRQVRGLLMAALRDSDGPVARATLDQVWPDAAQRDRCLIALVTDGLATRTGDAYALPD